MTLCLLMYVPPGLPNVRAWPDSCLWPASLALMPGAIDIHNHSIYLFTHVLNFSIYSLKVCQEWVDSLLAMLSATKHHPVWKFVQKLIFVTLFQVFRNSELCALSKYVHVGRYWPSSVLSWGLISHWLTERSKILIISSHHLVVQGSNWSADWGIKWACCSIVDDEISWNILSVHTCHVIKCNWKVCSNSCDVIGLFRILLFCSGSNKEATSVLLYDHLQDVDKCVCTVIWPSPRCW